MEPVLVTGGAGYIGSHACKLLASAGYLPVTFDNLSTGHSEAVRWGPLLAGDLADARGLSAAFAQYRFKAVMHFAACAYVGESMARPELYFSNNVGGMFNLLEVMRQHSVRNIVFSSSCATYGIPQSVPIAESERQSPVNPYGETKLIAEKMLHWYSAIHDFRYVSLRYFNAAGADPDGEIGEDHFPEPHLIPIVIEAALGIRPAVDIYGTDYPTPGGTAIRDFVHVCDLADAHLRALRYLDRKDGDSIALNLGSGRGHEVLDVVRAVENVAGRRVPVRLAPRRDGDPPVLIANAERAKAVLGWSAPRSDLGTIVQTAWDWHCGTQASSKAARGWQP